MEQIKIQYAPYYNRVEQIGTEVGVRCENRTFDEVDNESSSGREVRDDGDGKSLLPPSDNPFKVTVDLQGCLPKNHSRARLLCYNHRKVYIIVKLIKFRI